MATPSAWKSQRRKTFLGGHHQRGGGSREIALPHKWRVAARRRFFLASTKGGTLFTRGGSSRHHVRCGGSRIHRVRRRGIDGVSGTHVSSELVGSFPQMVGCFRSPRSGKNEKQHPLAWLNGKSAKDVERRRSCPCYSSHGKKSSGSKKRLALKEGRKGKKTRVPLYVWATAGMRILTDKSAN